MRGGGCGEARHGDKHSATDLGDDGAQLFLLVTGTAKPVGLAAGGTLAGIWQTIIGDRVTVYRQALAGE